MQDRTFPVGSSRHTAPRAASGRSGSQSQINQFNAIRISIASPEAIRGWSRGEVTKPETINYRTLKPERDGLLCERIFGPQKDWECHCGKYKRVRYKGVICDKCGVEVTRSKVRRERMGHIVLAAPVSHIWFVKGSPSYLSELLGVGQRNLEKVLYFAQYIVTSVDDAALKQTRERLQQTYRERRERIQAEADGRQIELSSQLTSMLGGVQTARQSTQHRIDDDFRARRDVLNAEAERIRSDLEDRIGHLVDEELSFHGQVLVEEGDIIGEKTLDMFDELVDQQLETLEALRQRELADAELLTDAERERTAVQATQERERLQGRLQTDLDRLVREEKQRLELLDGIKLKRIMSEGEYLQLGELSPGTFKAGQGAEAVRDLIEHTVDLDRLADELQAEIDASQGQRRKKATKRLRVVEAFRKSGNHPAWMILTVLPVIPPDLRPMVQLDGGRFAVSDLNDLYRRVINRNNRLKRMMDINAPPMILRNEMRMLQEAVDALIDNGRRGRAVSGKGKHRLKSLSDMLKGKQGRFRQNLLGKRVDYSGRSVIVVGPNLQLHQCGLPKKMALELFKPFVMQRLVSRGAAPTIKAAKRIVEQVRPEVWDVLEEVIKNYLVLLNRAPSLHRLSIQAFEAQLIEGSAIQLHPLVCAAFNADFDGDQMAVHVPLSPKAQEEARMRMLSKYNLLSPANGDPIITPSQDIVLGCYYLTLAKPADQALGAGKIFVSAEEALMAYEQGIIEMQAPIWVRLPQKYVRYDAVRGRDDMASLDALAPWLSPTPVTVSDPVHAARILELQQFRVHHVSGDIKGPTNALGVRTQADGVQLLETTVGLLIFNGALLPPLAYRNNPVAKSGLKDIIAECYRYYTHLENISDADLERFRLQLHLKRPDSAERPLPPIATAKSRDELARLFGSEMTALQADMLKALGFKYATLGGMTIGIDDIQVPAYKREIVAASERRETDVEKQFRRGLLSPEERYNAIVKIWQDATRETTGAVTQSLTRHGPVAMMINSAARGNINQLSQMAGMRGLMADPTGKIIELPIKSNFREGLSVLEYFVSTHGGRKGLADTALRTSDAGHLTRRLVDVAQANIVALEDCGTEDGLWLDAGEQQSLETRMQGRLLAIDLTDPHTGEVIATRNTEIDEALARRIGALGMTAVYVRSPMACQADHGICRLCYGRNLATGKLVDIGEAVGIIAAQSIGEPGTQLTLRTFHLGGVASADDITQGLPRVQEIFEARTPKGKALLAPIDGVIELMIDDTTRKVRVVSTEVYVDEHRLPPHYTPVVSDGDVVTESQVIAESNRADITGEPIVARLAGTVRSVPGVIGISSDAHTVRELAIPVSARLAGGIENGARVIAGQQLTEGSADPHELLGLQGREAVQRYLVNEAQRVYRTQGVVINDKHIEVIVRQMLRRVCIEEPGDTGWLPSELTDTAEFVHRNLEIVSQGGEPATAFTVLQGLTKAGVSADSFLSAASFQETPRGLTDAAVSGKVDYLRGLKENVIIGKLIPAGTGIEARRALLEDAAAAEQWLPSDPGALAASGDADILREITLASMGVAPSGEAPDAPLPPAVDDHADPAVDDHVEPAVEP